MNLIRTDDGSQVYTYQIDQRWVKKNRDPENVAYVLCLLFHFWTLSRTYLLWRNSCQRVLRLTEDVQVWHTY
jgi:hypothetical protein